MKTSSTYIIYLLATNKFQASQPKKETQEEKTGNEEIPLAFPQRYHSIRSRSGTATCSTGSAWIMQYEMRG